MSASIYKELRWLLPSDDFRGRCEQVLAAPSDDGLDLMSLANRSLGNTQLAYLSAQVKKLQARGVPLSSLLPLKLGLIGNGTLDLLVPAIEATGLRMGLLIECVCTEFGQGISEALDPHSKMNSAECDAFLVALDFRGLPLQSSVTHPQHATSSVEDAFRLLKDIYVSLRAHNPRANIIVQNLAPPPETLFGNFDKRVPGSLVALIEELNVKIVRDFNFEGCVLLDVATLAHTVGLAEWHSPTQWNMAKIPFSMDFAPLYADNVARVLSSLKGRARRVLVLDLDNTLWGGVIGDDGLGGILIGEGDGTGEAFLAVQKLALALRARGVVLAVASKNTDSIARTAFREHPDMLLREEHVAVFQANWNDKATNIKAISDELSLGLDAFVFLDDNPAERALVREYLPQVAVPELPDDPALFARTLAAAGYFETFVFSDEDRERASYYEANARRASLGQSVANMEDYIAALDMEADMRPFDSINRARIVQLINKSNQFNLTTRRYTEAEIKALEVAPETCTLQVRLKDRFGDNGMICAVICKPIDPETWYIDTWLMSCRVLGRGVERIVLGHILKAALQRGIRRVVGEYIPSKRNDLVRNHYENLGFSEVETKNSGATMWVISSSAIIDMPPVRFAVDAFNLEAAV